MEIVNPADRGGHRWLRWVGLQGPPPEPDSWVPVAGGFRPDAAQAPAQPETALATDWTSGDATKLVDALSQVGIEARQRPYSFSGVSPTPGSATTMDTGAEAHVGVLVHERDRSRALPVVAEFKRDFDKAERESYETLTEKELTRQAMAAAGDAGSDEDLRVQPPRYAQWQPIDFREEDPEL